MKCLSGELRLGDTRSECGLSARSHGSYSSAGRSNGESTIGLASAENSGGARSGAAGALRRRASTLVRAIPVPAPRISANGLFADTCLAFGAL